MALQFNPSLQRSAAEIAAGQGRAWQAGLKPNPIAGIDYQQIGSRGQAEQFGALLQQEFVAREKLQLSRQVAGHEVQKLEQQFAAQRLRILTDVRVAFVRSLRAQRQIELTTELLSISSTSLQIAEQLKEAEEVSRIDVLQAEMEVEQARIARQNAQNRRAAAWLELAAVVGQPNMPMQPLTGPLRTPTDERRFEQVLQNLRLTSPEVKAVSAQIQRERCNLRRQEIEPRPNLTVQGLVNWQDNGIGGSADGGLVVSLPIPVWNRNQGAIKSAYHGLIAAERQLNTVELELQQRLAQVFERYGNALQQTTRYEQLILPKSAETLKLTRTAYENGEIDYVNLLTIQRTFAQNQLAYLEVLESLRVTEAEMDGLLLSSSLASLSGTPLR
jgi:cobalt-zinc-cadmium efflux system outer membrane protein